MTWNYRIVKYKDGSGYGIHEVFYDDKGSPWGMTKAPDGFCTDIDEEPKQLYLDLVQALRDIILHDVFEEPEVWPGDGFYTDLDSGHDVQHDTGCQGDLERLEEQLGDSSRLPGDD